MCMEIVQALKIDEKVAIFPNKMEWVMWWTVII